MAFFIEEKLQEMSPRNNDPIIRLRGKLKGLVTVPGHLNDDLAPGTVNSILKQTGLKP